jgi:MbtH protein
MDGDREYEVVVNSEQQYSIWPAEKPELPNGWRSAGFRSTKDRCLSFIKETWTDMRPASLRRDLESTSKSSPDVRHDVRPSPYSSNVPPISNLR